MFCTTRNVTYHSSLRNERPHIFDAALPHKSRIHPDWADGVNPTLLETHIGPLLGDKTTLRDPGCSNARIWRPSSHISVACQNVTGSSQPYSRAGWACRLISVDLAPLSPSIRNLKSHDTPDGSNGVDLKHRDVVRTTNAMVIHSVGRTRREPPEKTTKRPIVFFTTPGPLLLSAPVTWGRATARCRVAESTYGVWWW